MGQVAGRNILYFRHTGLAGEILRCVRGGSQQQYAYWLVSVDTLFDANFLFFYTFLNYDQTLAGILDGTYEVVPIGALPWM